jgi:hypothetical protein
VCGAYRIKEITSVVFTLLWRPRGMNLASLSNSVLYAGWIRVSVLPSNGSFVFFLCSSLAIFIYDLGPYV